MPDQHTPGPWTFEYENEYHDGGGFAEWFEVQADGDRIAKVDEEADARLIAAAPDLLAACREVLGEIERQQHARLYPDVVDLLRCAIDSATREPVE